MKKKSIILRDIAFICGISLISYGLYIVYPSMTYIFLGLIFIALTKIKTEEKK